MFGKRPGVAEQALAGDRRRAARIVGPVPRIDHRDRPVVFAASVAGREDRHHFRRSRNRLGVDHQDARMLVPVEYHLRGAVRVGGPQMMVVDLGSVDIFPALIQDAAVGQRPRRVVVFHIGRQRAEVSAVGVAAVQHGDLGQPALDPALAAAGDEHDAVVGQIGRFDVVVGPVGQLPQVAAVHVDLVQMIVLGAAGPVREQDFPAS
jgi:hypothetical protein